MLSAGFTKQSTRQFKIWDPRSLANPLATCDIDQAAGVMMPFYDNDTGLLFLAGKGDGNIRYYEIVNEEPYFYYVTDSRSTQSAKGVGIVPKRAVDVSKCEVARLLKLTNNAVEPISFIVPRRVSRFLY